MTRETVIIFVKALLTLAGSYLIGDNVFGSAIDYDLWQVIAGVVMSGVSIYWSIQDKNYTIESLQAFARQVLMVGGGFLIASGRITAEQLESAIGVALVVIPVLQSYLSKKKAQKVQDGRLQVHNLASISKKQP